MQLLFFIVVTSLFVWLINRWNFRGSVSLAYKLPSNKLHTFFGCGKILRPNNIIQYLYNVGSKYGSKWMLWLGPIPFFVTSDPETIKEIFTSKNCVDKPAIIMHNITVSGGLGLVTANEPIWSRHRKVMNKAFSNKNILSFLPIFHKEINSMIQKMDNILEKGENVNLMEMLSKLTLTNASRTMLKRDLFNMKFDFATMTNYFKEAMKYATDLSITMFYKIAFIRKLAEITIFKNGVEGVATFHRFIDESRDILLKNDSPKSTDFPEMKCILDYALIGINENQLQMDEVQGEMMQIFFAAYETTTTTMFLVILMLAMHPEYQERAYDEIINKLPDTNDICLTFNDLDQLSNIDMILNETMRIIPMVPHVIRKVKNEKLTLENGLTLPVGQNIFIDIFSLHHSKELWGVDADVFNPDNFLPSNNATRHPYSFIPFTKGLRYCIGWRFATSLIKMSLAKLIKRYKFTTDFKFKDLQFQSRLVIKLIEEPQIYIERRVLSK